MNEIEKTNWQEKLSLVKQITANNASNAEFELFLHIAKKYELDPLAKQIWLVKYGQSPAQIFTGRDGFLSIAHRSNEFEAMETEIIRIDEPFEVAGHKFDFQYKAICRIYKKNSNRPWVSEVYESEYNTGKALWLTKRRVMVGKVSESTCLRKAFDISGLYSPEEFDNNEKEIKVEQVKQIEPNREITKLKMFEKLKKQVPDLLSELKKKCGSTENAYALCHSLDWNIQAIQTKLSTIEV